MHLAVVALCIIFINIQKNPPMSEKDSSTSSTGSRQISLEQDTSKVHFWLINILQFFFGGLLSTFLVFYFRSVALAVTWPFLLFLLVAFIANERLKKHYARLTFQISFFYLSLLSFAIFIVPVLFHRIGRDIFLIRGFGSLVVLWLFLRGLGFFVKKKFRKNEKMLYFSVASIFLATNILYFFNLIPPIPLSLKDGGIYHFVSRNSAGNFVVQSENKGWPDYFSLHENFHAVKGDLTYAYSAIFSPASFNTDIIHEWQTYDPTRRKWITANRVDLIALGGRDGGYRTYSTKANIAPGEWRVNVETSQGQIIGRLRFNVIATDAEPALKTDVKQ